MVRKSLTDDLDLSPEAIIADSEYDSAGILGYIMDILGARPRISRNPRRTASDKSDFNSSGVPVCIAGFDMLFRGIFYNKAQNRMRHKFVWSHKGVK